jgi:hypothetical protein
LKASCVCPHCWHRFRPDEVLWIAAHPELVGDPLLSAEDPVRFLPSRFTPEGHALDPLGGRTRRLACPRCHLEIPPLVLERPMVILSIAGSPSSGKSYFLASAMWKLREDLARHFSVAFTDTDPGMNRMLTSNESQLFLSEDRDALVAIEKTELQGAQYNSVQFDPGVSTLLAHPFIFTVRPGRDHINGQGAAHLTTLLTLYDNAGEHFLPGADTTRAPGTQHLARAQVLMFVFDPTQDVRFRHRLQGESSDPQLAPGLRTVRQDLLLVEMARRIRLHAGLAPQERIRKPLFLLMSKSDIWSHLLRDTGGAPVDVTTPPYARERPGLGKMGIRRVDRTSGLVRELLLAFAPEVVSAAEDAFERVIYVPVSATGTSPILDPATGLLKMPVDRIAPAWCAVPFAYALARWSTHLMASDKSEGREDFYEGAEAPGSASEGAASEDAAPEPEEAERGA